ncbi:MAG TPA: class I SAM-dependent methyltransferase [Streptosporangiaceae bacterium]|nr:class I SAM-dependent methyltransferase [Streptosporangiaceae bacterium]
MDSDRERAIEQIRNLVAESLRDGDTKGWFERLYAKAEAGEVIVPWADGEPNTNLISWASSLSGAGKRALVPGCGLGYDAEFLASLGYDVTAFDISPTGIEAAKRDNPGSAVNYQVADLTDLPAEWIHAFDLVMEAYTLQPLFGEVRAAAIASVHRAVAPGGTLLIIARATNEIDPQRDPTLMPWPLTHGELIAAGGSLRVHRIEQYWDAEDPPRLRWRAEFRHA